MSSIPLSPLHEETRSTGSQESLAHPLLPPPRPTTLSQQPLSHAPPHHHQQYSSVTDDRWRHRLPVPVSASSSMSSSGSSSTSVPRSHGAEYGDRSYYGWAGAAPRRSMRSGIAGSASAELLEDDGRLDDPHWVPEEEQREDGPGAWEAEHRRAHRLRLQHTHHPQHHPRHHRHQQPLQAQHPFQQHPLQQVTMAQPYGVYPGGYDGSWDLPSRHPPPAAVAQWGWGGEQPEYAPQPLSLRAAAATAAATAAAIARADDRPPPPRTNGSTSHSGDGPRLQRNNDPGLAAPARSTWTSPPSPRDRPWLQRGGGGSGMEVRTSDGYPHATGHDSNGGRAVPQQFPHSAATRPTLHSSSLSANSGLEWVPHPQRHLQQREYHRGHYDEQLYDGNGPRHAYLAAPPMPYPPQSSHQQHWPQASSSSSYDGVEPRPLAHPMDSLAVLEAASGGASSATLTAGSAPGSSPATMPAVAAAAAASSHRSDSGRSSERTVAAAAARTTSELASTSREPTRRATALAQQPPRKRAPRTYYKFTRMTHLAMTESLRLMASTESSTGPPSIGAAARLHDLCHRAAPTPAERKRWKRLAAALAVVDGAPEGRNLTWRTSTLVITPQEDWHQIVSAVHHANHRQSAHFSYRQTLEEIRTTYETRRSRCGIPAAFISQVVADCGCDPTVGNGAHFDSDDDGSDGR
ncbi:hypothetical protein BC828DRAFT_406335 [Blastocladiella britannica]|nr:hypothetical protein BC828DRAFT_406335 [Blastocladiella britannica]